MQKTLLLTCVLVFVGIRCAPAAQEAPLATNLSVTPLALTTAPGSLAPNLTLGPDGTAYASWIDPLETGHALRFATLSAEATAWSTPQTIAEGENWFVNWADFPSMGVSEDGVLLAHWLVKNGQGTYAYGVQISQSRDGGQTWTPPQWLHDDQSASEHGFATLTPTGNGTFQAVWLDGRQFAQGHASMTLRTRTVAADGTLGLETEVDGLICDCCPQSAVRLSDGSLLVAYRNRTEDEIRDIYTARFANGTWHTPTAVHDDQWQINGCPVNGPALATNGQTAAVAWFAAPLDQSRVQVAFSQDGGQTFAPPTRVDAGQPTGRVALAMHEDGSAVVTWIEKRPEAETAHILLRHLRADGEQSELFTVHATATSRASGYPRLVRQGNRLLFAWTETGEQRHVRTAIGVLE